jgi:hypothetical protein
MVPPMPSPVSPDAGVPEHQPDQHRPNGRPWTGGRAGQTPNGPRQSEPRPRPGQFQPTGQPQPGPFRTNQPQSGQFPARPGAGRPGAGPLPPGAGGPPGEPSRNRADDGDGRKATGRRDWIWSVVAFLIAAGVIGAVGFHFFGPDSTEEEAVAWAVDACAGPDPTAEDTGAPTDTYRPLPCDDAEATVTVLDIQDAVSIGQAHCPTGTDVVFQKDGQAGGVTQAVCARNLSDDHPGDPGMGGGQLMTGDCVNGDGGEVACSADGARKVASLMVSGNACPEGTADEIELGFDPQRSYATICLAKG